MLTTYPRASLADGTKHEFAYAMIVPPFVGQAVIARTTAIADDMGYVRGRDTNQTETYDWSARPSSRRPPSSPDDSKSSRSTSTTPPRWPNASVS